MRLEAITSLKDELGSVCEQKSVTKSEVQDILINGNLSTVSDLTLDSQEESSQDIAWRQIVLSEQLELRLTNPDVMAGIVVSTGASFLLEIRYW